MQKQLVLENGEGQVVRTYAWDGRPVEVIRRADTRRLELVADTESYAIRKIRFHSLGRVDFREAEEHAFGPDVRLRLVDAIAEISRDERVGPERDRAVYGVLLAIVLVATVTLGYLATRPAELARNEEALKQEVIKIVKKIPARPRAVTATAATTKTADQPKTLDRVKRMGALSVLGALNKGKHAGGLDISAVNTTAGPGLGGTAGSGGTQTSLYAKGLTAAPLGAGGRAEGAGGYGTKGKGGGQAGYGKMTMVGSTGAGPIALTQEASVDTGLDREAIAAVINRNLGQVRFCYEQGLQTDPNAGGRVAVDFVIGGAGAVKVASVANSSLGSKVIEDCIVTRLKGWKFPLPQGGVDVKVSYPFVLRRAGQG